MYRTNTEHADASPTAQFNTLENPNESITRNNNFSSTPCSIWRARTPVSRRRICRAPVCANKQINPSNGCTGAINGSRRTTAALWSRRIIRDQLPPLSRRTYGGGGPGSCWPQILGARSFRLDGTPAWNPSMALDGTRRANFLANQSHGARTDCGNCAATLQRASSGFAQFAFGQFQFNKFHIVWQRWSIALAAWSLVCPTFHFQHSRKDFATCQ